MTDEECMADENCMTPEKLKVLQAKWSEGWEERWERRKPLTDLEEALDTYVQTLPNLKLCQDFCRTYHIGGSKWAGENETSVNGAYHSALFGEISRRGCIWDIHFSLRSRKLLRQCLTEAERLAADFDSRGVPNGRGAHGG